MSEGDSLLLYITTGGNSLGIGGQPTTTRSSIGARYDENHIL